MNNSILIGIPESYTPSEDYTFAIGAHGTVFETIMTLEEFETISSVIKRAYNKV
jgi:hypothetical protein